MAKAPLVPWGTDHLIGVDADNPLWKGWTGKGPPMKFIIRPCADCGRRQLVEDGALDRASMFGVRDVCCSGCGIARCKANRWHPYEEGD